MTTLRLIFTGDSLIQRPISACPHPGFASLRRLLSTADVAMTNLEVCIQQGEDWPAFVSGGGRGTTYMASPVACARDLLDLGFHAVTCANNHAQDFGEGGILTTIRHLDSVGLAHAGTGATLTAASAPTYLDTAQGRVALISAADWGARGLADLTYPWPVGAMAADPDAVFPGRPGVNLLRYDAELLVDQQAIDALRRISHEMGWELSKAVRNAGGGRSEPYPGTDLIAAETDSDSRFHFMGRRFVRSSGFSFRTVAFEEDLQRLRRWTAEARSNADLVVVGIHQQGASRSEAEPPDHIRSAAEATLNAGADIFVAHGRGRAGGIEYIDGKVAVYGLPGFINQLEQMPAVPAEQRARYGLGPETTPQDFVDVRRQAEAGGAGTAIGRGINDFRPLAAHEFMVTDGRVSEIRLHPIRQLASGQRAFTGVPVLLNGTDPAGSQTLSALQERMSDWPVDVSIVDGYLRVAEK